MFPKIVKHDNWCVLLQLQYVAHDIPVIGKIFIELEPNYGYTFDYNIKSYWSAIEPDQSNPGYYLYGDGERKVNVDAPKGDMEIVKYR